ncbi:hypothetical protein [Fusobacterium varium]|mgnify:CR=1 FL=1|uniref:hypothetical protein n=1 Tax=Fusobacterium varium TaxID=856 RepID=UPI0030D2F882
MLEVKFPNYLKNDFETYQFIVKHLYLMNLSNLFESPIREEINLDFKKLNFVEGNLCATIAMFVDELLGSGEVTYSNLSPIIENFFRRNEFCRKLSIEPLFNYINTTMRFKEFSDNSNDEEIGRYIYNEFLNNEGINIKDKTIKEKIQESVFELFENAKFHGESEKIYTCGQFFPRNKKILFSIADIGYTIPKNVKKKKNFSTESDCIEWALGYGNSTKDLKNGIPGGAGLFLLEKFIELTKGRLQIISGKGFFEKDYNNEEYKILKKDLEYQFPGTVINLEFNISHGEKLVIATENEEFADILERLIKEDTSYGN